MEHFGSWKNIATMFKYSCIIAIYPLQYFVLLIIYILYIYALNFLTLGCVTKYKDAQNIFV